MSTSIGFDGRPALRGRDPRRSPESGLASTGSGDSGGRRAVDRVTHRARAHRDPRHRNGPRRRAPAGGPRRAGPSLARRRPRSTGERPPFARCTSRSLAGSRTIFRPGSWPPRSRSRSTRTEASSTSWPGIRVGAPCSSSSSRRTSPTSMSLLGTLDRKRRVAAKVARRARLGSGQRVGLADRRGEPDEPALGSMPIGRCLRAAMPADGRAMRGLAGRSGRRDRGDLVLDRYPRWDCVGSLTARSDGSIERRRPGDRA